MPAHPDPSTGPLPRGHRPVTPDAAPQADRIDAFVASNFGLRGTLRLHRHALGWDLLRAPVNVLLAPVFLLTRLLALLCALLRLRRPARWLAARRVHLRTDVARELDSALRETFLPDGPDAVAVRPAQARLIEDYTAVRSAVAEICTTLVVLALGYLLFRTPTPGIVSLAPIVSEQAVRSEVVSAFPFGQGLGGLWYGVFPVELPVWYVVAVGIGLAMAASLVTTFAGLVADPVQAALGIHRRRLRRLVARLDAAAAGPGLAGEHVLARIADLTDIGTSLLRLFRA